MTVSYIFFIKNMQTCLCVCSIVLNKLVITSNSIWCKNTLALCMSAVHSHQKLVYMFIWQLMWRVLVAPYKPWQQLITCIKALLQSLLPTLTQQSTHVNWIWLLWDKLHIIWALILCTKKRVDAQKPWLNFIWKLQCFSAHSLNWCCPQMTTKSHLTDLIGEISTVYFRASPVY